MTVAKVVDASALGAVVFREPEADRVNALLGDAILVAPVLLIYEMANVCLTKIRRHAHQRDAYLAQFAAFRLIPIEFADIEYGEALSLAETSRLSFYDAVYLWLALGLNAELITLDKELHAAWLACGG